MEKLRRIFQRRPKELSPHQQAALNLSATAIAHKTAHLMAAETAWALAELVEAEAAVDLSNPYIAQIFKQSRASIEQSGEQAPHDLRAAIAQKLKE